MAEELCESCHKAKIFKEEFLICYYCGHKIHFKCVYGVFFNNGGEQNVCWDCTEKTKPITIELSELVEMEPEPRRNSRKYSLRRILKYVGR